MEKSALIVLQCRIKYKPHKDWLSNFMPTRCSIFSPFKSLKKFETQRLGLQSTIVAHERGNCRAE